MSRSRLYSVLTHLHRTHQGEGLPDVDLLARFAQLRDEAAFELLVWRHQRMVLGVCQRLLRDAHDAEDAFQAAFLTLARKAPSIGRREAVASWLYKVAYRCALRVRQTVRRQRQGVVNGVDPANVAVADSSLAGAEQDDLRELLDEEVQRLPAKYRAAVVLCYLEGKSYQQAAVESGCPAGTLSARLHTAREKLRRRLMARGIAPAAALAVLENTRETHAAAGLAAIAVKAARQILTGQSAADVVSSRTVEVATEVMQAMCVSKPKIIVVLLMGGLSGLTTWAASQTLPLSVEMSTSRVAAPSVADTEPEPPKKEKEEAPFEAILRKWAEADARYREMYVRFTTTDRDRVFDTTTITEGQASIKKPDLWRIDRLDKQGRKLNVLLWESKRFHLFDAETKTERILVAPEVPNGKREKGIRFDLPWFVWDWSEQTRWLSFGPQARDIDSRYKLGLAKQDQWYIYLDIEPRGRKSSWFEWFPERWFERGRIVLEHKTYQVRQVWFEYPNQKEITVDFLVRRMNPKEPITRKSLLEGLPQGWEREELKESEKEKE